MIRFVILSNPSNETFNIVKGFLKDVTSYNVYNNVVSFLDFEDSIEALKNLSDDFFIDMIVSEASEKFSIDDSNWLNNLYEKSNLKGFVLEKEILIKTLDLSEYTKKRVLKSNYNIFENLEVIKKFLECSMNMSKASIELYMHRNTLISKIEKFYLETGYDPKNFKDAFILYNLIK